MSKHTAGPWSCGQFHWYDNSPGQCEITQYGEMGILAHVCLPAKGRIGHEEGKANTRLIAAAPDLLEAAKAVLSVRWIGYKTESENQHDEIWHQLNKAVTKAEVKP